MLIIIGSAQQYHQFRALMVKQDAILTPATASPAPQAINQDRIAKLFGIHAAQSASPPQTTNLQLKLLGSFVNVTPEISAALIQAKGKLARRLIVGQYVVTGVHLAAVSADHVLLERNGATERLFSPRIVESAAADDRAAYRASYAPLNTYHLGKLTGISSEQARQKNQLLRKLIKHHYTNEKVQFSFTAYSRHDLLAST
ncbi:MULTISPECIES: type II secretion system protein N [Pseudomonadaceae]|uniref:Type II secretion system protein GspC N-terminal domain-containing protein n=1 Tax=Aquipseudomonas alcaligenes TaxID=43263 RepID=A0AB73HYF2_AQUAC|nr:MULTISPECIES: type II secretion system protein N [Pseudomonas]MCB2256643.1 hypothetical protein [Pseudomonas chlororaphis]MDH0142817.1 hypothetical protein [Pseudomonas alcaligenes]